MLFKKKLGGTAEEWLKKGLALTKLKRYEEAIECYDKALDIAPDYDVAKERKLQIMKNIKRSL